MKMAPRPGLEPGTYGLTDGGSDLPPDGSEPQPDAADCLIESDRSVPLPPGAIIGEPLDKRQTARSDTAKVSVNECRLSSIWPMHFGRRATECVKHRGTA